MLQLSKVSRWLIREARAYNTTISLHINMVDAFEESPLWDTYTKMILLHVMSMET